MQCGANMPLWHDVLEGPRFGYTSTLSRRRPCALADRLGAGRLIAALGGVLTLGDHDPAPEGAHDRAVLLVAARLDVDDPTVWLGCRLLYLEYGRLAVDRVAVERRCQVAQ